MFLLRMRGALAVLLAATLALPAYTCSGYRAPNGELVNAIPAGVDSTGYVATDVPHRPIEDFQISEPWPWLTLLAYSWPLLLVGAASLRPRFAQSWMASVLGMALPLASAWWIYSLVISGSIAYGGVLSLGALGALWLIAVWEAFARRRARALLRHSAFPPQ